MLHHLHIFTCAVRSNSTSTERYKIMETVRKLCAFYILVYLNKKFITLPETELRMEYKK